MTAALVLIPVAGGLYNGAAEVIPPVRWERRGFLMGDPVDHRVCTVTGQVASTYWGFVVQDARSVPGGLIALHFVLSKPVTTAEWDKLKTDTLPEVVIWTTKANQTARGRYIHPTMGHA